MKNLKPKTARYVSWIISGIGLLILMIGMSTKLDPLSIIGTIVIIAGMVFMFFFYACPHCGKPLDPRTYGEFCPYCGEKINE